MPMGESAKLLGKTRKGGRCISCSRMASPTSVLQYEAMVPWEAGQPSPGDSSSVLQYEAMATNWEGQQPSYYSGSSQLHEGRPGTHDLQTHVSSNEGNGWSTQPLPRIHFGSENDLVKEAAAGVQLELPRSREVMATLTPNESGRGSGSSPENMSPCVGAAKSMARPLAARANDSGKSMISKERHCSRTSSVRRRVPTTMLEVNCSDFRELVEGLTGVNPFEATSLISKLGSKAHQRAICEAEHPRPEQSCSCVHNFENTYTTSSNTNNYSSLNVYSSLPNIVTTTLTPQTTTTPLPPPPHVMNSHDYYTSAAAAAMQQPTPDQQQQLLQLQQQTPQTMTSRIPLLLSAAIQLPNHPGNFVHQISNLNVTPMHHATNATIGNLFQGSYNNPLQGNLIFGYNLV